MTEKRFTYIKNSLITQYQSIPIQKIGKGKPFHCQGLVDELNKLWNENEQLNEENKELKAKVDDKEVAVEVECEKLMQKVFNLINGKIKLYSHKPVSAPISQPMSVNFDVDMDRLARLSELEALKEELQE